MTISGLTKGRVFGESQIARYRLFPAPAGPSPAPQGGFRGSGLLDLLAESQITASPRHSAPGRPRSQFRLLTLPQSWPRTFPNARTSGCRTGVGQAFE